MIRTILIALTLFLYLVLLLPVLGIEWIYHKINPEKADYQQLRMVQAAFRLMLKMTGARIQVIGEENVPKDRAVLYVGNHKSYFDILLTYSRVPRLTGYVAKKEMESFPILSIWMKRLHCLFLDRKDIKQGLKTILTGIDLIKNGISVCIFPEGTRNQIQRPASSLQGRQPEDGREDRLPDHSLRHHQFFEAVRRSHALCPSL